MSAPLGLVATALENDLRSFLLSNPIAVWLDIDGHYTKFVDRLCELREAAGIPYDVFGFRGSHLELMLALEAMVGGVEKRPIVVHLPGFNEKLVEASPVLELYAAGKRYRKALDTLIQEAAAGLVAPEAVTDFLARGHVTLDDADDWLAASVSGHGDALSAALKVMTVNAIVDDLLSSGAIAKQIDHRTSRDAVMQHLAIQTGMPAEWREANPIPDGPGRADSIVHTVASWAMAVEYVDDLRRKPIDAKLAPALTLANPLVATNCKLTAHLRANHSDAYQRSADETEARLLEEVENARAEDLGKIDTFRFEEKAVLQEALDALRDHSWETALQWARARLDGRSFWLDREPTRRTTWQLIASGATLGVLIDRAGEFLGPLPDLGRAVDLYVEHGAAVDTAHRHLEQSRRTNLNLLLQLPEFVTLRERLDDLRAVWRHWADGWAREFNAACRQVGFLPEPSLQQRTLFDEVVRPLTRESGTTALFMVDALRYEMGAELCRSMATTAASNVQIRARLAELPTVTEIGMNVLAPVATNGRLSVVMKDGRVQGFSTGQFRVLDPETRRRAMADRVGGATCPLLKLQDVLDRDLTSLRQTIARAQLVVVHSEEIDRAGEKNAGLGEFDNALQKIEAAWRILREAGVSRFVITADHGFLLLDERVGGPQPHGRKIDPNRRHVIGPHPTDHDGEARVALSDLGYDGATGHFMCPESVAAFDTGNRARSFVHGGNSLAERVIPVLTVIHRQPAGASGTRYEVTARIGEGVAGMHRIHAKVEVVAQASLAFSGRSEVTLAIRAVDEPEVQVDVCQVGPGNQHKGSTVIVPVGEWFEVFFRLSGPAESRVAIQLVHEAREAEVAPCVIGERFAVTTLIGNTQQSARPPRLDDQQPAWLNEFEDDGVRRLFAQLAKHGAVTEPEAANLLGGQRQARRFATKFEEHAKRASFTVRIDVVGGVKRYVREGSGQ